MEELNLEPPKAVSEVKVEDIKERAGTKEKSFVKIKDEMVSSLDKQVDGFVNELLGADNQSGKMKDLSSAIHNMGSAEVRKTTQASNRMLDRPLKELSNGGLSEASKVGKNLLEMRRTVEDLDPRKQKSFMSMIKKILPFGDTVDNFVKGYQSAQSHIQAINESLMNGKDELLQDNAAIEVEKESLWELMTKLEQFIYMSRRLDEKIEEKLPGIEAQDPYKAKVVREDILFYLRQKSQDLLTHMAVTIQGYMALDLIRKNNMELIKGVDRATTTTLSALHTALTVAQALSQSKQVAGQIKSLREGTGNLIESTSEMLGEHSKDVMAIAAEPAVAAEQMGKAFDKIFKTMDDIDSFKLKALDNMKKTVENLDNTVTKAKKHLDKNREKVIADVKNDLSSNDDGDTSGAVKLL